MSSSEVGLIVHCDNPAAEVLVIDGAFRLVAHGPPPLRARVEPGIYALKAKIGGETTEQLEELAPRDQDYTFTLRAPEFESPMPLTQTATNREYHQNSLEQFTRQDQPVVSVGSGSGVVIYVRDTSRRNFELAADQKASYARAFDGFRLLDRRGAVLVNFDDQLVKHLDMGYVGAQIHVNPGHYVLAWGRGDPQTCFALNTAPGWTLQTYLRLQPASPGLLDMRPDFADAAFAYDRLGAVYSAYRDDYRAMEAMRLAMLDRRNLVRGDTLRSILDGKYENPMLGLYGGCLLVAHHARDVDLLGQVIQNTARLLGSLNPDVVALAWAYEAASGKRPRNFDPRPWPEILADLEGPPLLTQCWDLLVRCAESFEIECEFMPVFGPAGHVCASGIVLTWERSKYDALRAPPAPALAAPIAAPAPAAPPSAPSPPAAAAPPRPAAPGSGILARLGRALWTNLAKRTVATSEGAVATPPPMKVEFRTEMIATPQDAAHAIKILARKAPWPRLVTLMYSQRDDRDELTTFSPLQRDLVATLARAVEDPEILESVDEAYINSLMQAHRVPIKSIGSAIRALDVIAVSTDLVRRLASLVKSPPAARTDPTQRPPEGVA